MEESLKVYELLSYSAAAVNNEDVLKSKRTLEVMNKITDLMKLHPFLEMPYISLSEGQKKKGRNSRHVHERFACLFVR